MILPSRRSGTVALTVLLAFFIIFVSHSAGQQFPGPPVTPGSQAEAASQAAQQTRKEQESAGRQADAPEDATYKAIIDTAPGDTRQADRSRRAIRSEISGWQISRASLFRIDGRRICQAGPREDESVREQSARSRSQRCHRPRSVGLGYPPQLRPEESRVRASPPDGRNRTNFAP